MNIFNGSIEDGLFLLGFYEYPRLQILLFLIFLTLYLLCLLENIILILIIYVDSQLHTPMYFFLSNLSFVDISFPSIIVPKFLLTFLNIRSMSKIQCVSQFYLYSVFQCNEILILMVMSYDRYVAICNPLHYHMVLSRKTISLLLAMTWFASLLFPTPNIYMILLWFPFCKDPIIDHLFCDLEPLLKLLCGDLTQMRFLMQIDGALITGPSILLTLTSYIFIILVILKIKSSEGRFKAFSTCSSHISVIIMLYLSLVCVYFLPQNQTRNAKSASLLNTLMIPMLNPLLYSLRNREVKVAFQRCVSKIVEGTFFKKFRK
ncbi:hypothetical protein GDO81_022572 [Engystomops pustulosus]|uniref:G-protein coupled receptors family 1 profile domain-containing protein n=1 Tax=Engystomops pustulosus TaxID=76066 RepID=A0AAV6ZAI3_ENGPU|nr:hypothetical protein GDO81_022572 [Engystomops pustulosus]